jgi:hypothetical protein
MVIG